jgi:hypothetical protein
VKSIAMRLRRLELAGSPTSLADYELLRRIEAARSRAGATTRVAPARPAEALSKCSRLGVGGPVAQRQNSYR